ncbi:uncharacterized protein [Montipora foliosa]|uniref:uncharacterized protein n=1 Tax=Montipora foliosa TaxID=591990 RepID=UPI0035F10A3E
MTFADDAAFVSHAERGQQAIIDRFATACQDFGFTIIKKTEVLPMPGTDAEPTILISSQALNSVDAFKYLGSAITSNLSLNSDFNALFASSAPCCIGERRGLHTRDKKLDALHFRFLRKILEITWKDKITNQEVLETAELPTIQYLVSERRLRRWLGHWPRAPSKRPTLWTAVSRKTINRTASSSLQRRLQTRHEGSHVESVSATRNGWLTTVLSGG